MSTEIAKLEALDIVAVQRSMQGYEITLEQMTADYLPLLKTPISDKKQLEVVKAARMNFKNTRLEGVQRLDAGCKALYANWKLWVKARDTFEAKFSREEELFRAKEKEFEEAEERKFLEIAQAEQRRVAARKERMYEIGFKFDGRKYILDGFAELTEDEVSGLGVDDLQLGEWLSDIERQVIEHKERQEEAARTAKIAADALAAQQKAEADRIAAAQAELERKQQEMEQKERLMNARIYVDRRKQLDDQRLIFSGEKAIWISDDTRVALDDIATISQDDWDAYVLKATEVRRLQDIEMEKLRIREEEEMKVWREKEEAERLEREQKLREEAAARAVEEERSRVAAEAEAEEKKKELLAQQEQERIAAQGDKGRILHIVDQLNEVIQGLPEMNSAVGQHTHKTLTKQLGDIVRMLETASKDL